MKAFSAILSYLAIIVATVGAWLTALITDIRNDEVMWVLLDILVSPVGLVRGWLMWFGVV